MTTTTLSSGFTRRRKAIIRNGKRIVRAIDQYVARHSMVPDLPVYARGAFAWEDDLERNWRDIRSELEGILAYRDDIPRFQDISPDQYRISPDNQWHTFILFGFGTKSQLNCSLCPKTTAILERLPGLQTAFFSILAPGKHVPRHKGVTKAFLRCHLGLKVPKQQDQCWMDVGGHRCVWEEGKVFVFDDTYPHEVWNNTDEERVVLLLDVERPMPTATRLLTRSMMWLFRRSPLLPGRQSQSAPVGTAVSRTAAAGRCRNLRRSMPSNRALPSPGNTV